MKFSQLKSANKATEDGQWVEYSEGFELKLKPVGSREYDRAIGKAVRKDRKAIRRGGKLSDEKLEVLTQAATAKTVVLDWKGLVDDNDQPIPFSPEKCAELFAANYSFYKDVLELAANLQDEKDDEENAELGN